jgi:hypothetical protein
MTEESKNEETLRIEISHFASPLSKPSQRLSKKDNREDVSGDSSMKISIERKSNKKSIINVNVNDSPTDRGSSDNIQIKIGKNKRKESGASLTSSPRKKRIEEEINSVQVPLNIDAMPTAKTERCDALGNVIKKGKDKKQRITFQDQLSKKNDLIKFVDIESFKAYNVDVSQTNFGGHIKPKSCCGNLCVIC